jgi:hypothetical protein
MLEVVIMVWNSSRGRQPSHRGIGPVFPIGVAKCVSHKRCYSRIECLGLWSNVGLTSQLGKEQTITALNLTRYSQ